jgi:uncharacterized protein YqeY
MNLRQQVKQDFITAFKARDKQKADALRNLESSLKQVEIDTREELSDSDVIKILKKELKKRNESIEIYIGAGRQELADGERFEVDIIKTYLPEELDRIKIEEIVNGVISEIGEGANFGEVMKESMNRVAGNADGKLVAEIVKEKWEK